MGSLNHSKKFRPLQTEREGAREGSRCLDHLQVLFDISIVGHAHVSNVDILAPFLLLCVTMTHSLLWFFKNCKIVNILGDCKSVLKLMLLDCKSKIP